MARSSRFPARAGYNALQPERARTDRTADSPAQARLGGHSHTLHPDSDAGCSGRNGEIRAEGRISKHPVIASCATTVRRVGRSAAAKLLKNLVAAVGLEPTTYGL
jgi:hypothetical protein